MKPSSGGVLTTAASSILLPKTNFFLTQSNGAFSLTLRLNQRRFCLRVSCSSEVPDSRMAASQQSPQKIYVPSDTIQENEVLNFEVRSPLIPANFFQAPKLSLSDQAFFLLSFIACTTSAAIAGFVVAAVPTLFAMRRAAISLSKLADTAREELPSTMAAIRLSGMEISDLILELSDLSQEITEGVSKSTQAVQAAEAGIRQIGSAARQQTMSMIQERASLPVISLQPVVAGAARKTSHVVGQATKTFLNIISRGELNSVDEDNSSIDSIQS